MRRIILALVFGFFCADAHADICAGERIAAAIRPRVMTGVSLEVEDINPHVLAVHADGYVILRVRPRTTPIVDGCPGAGCRLEVYLYLDGRPWRVPLGTAGEYGTQTGGPWLAQNVGLTQGKHTVQVVAGRPGKTPRDFGSAIACASVAVDYVVERVTLTVLPPGEDRPL